MFYLKKEKKGIVFLHKKTHVQKKISVLKNFLFISGFVS